MSTREAPHIIEARSTQEQALMHRCPFCHSDPGQLCRTERGRGRELDYSHSRRIDLSRPAEERRPTTQVNALCCTCGNLRTVSSDYRRYQDPEHDQSEQGEAEGWRKTQGLKCDVCGERTRHALLASDADAQWRDSAERQQRIALGGTDSTFSWTDEYLARMRAEYFAKFPRNPQLSHRYWIKDADDRREQGETHMKALCGAEMEIPSSSSSNKSKRSKYALIEPDRIDWDTEFEDPETGMWWVDMECVDCLRLANEHRRESAKDRAAELINWYIGAMPKLNHAEVEELIAFLDPAANATWERWQQEKKKQADEPS